MKVYMFDQWGNHCPCNLFAMSEAIFFFFFVEQKLQSLFKVILTSIFYAKLWYRYIMHPYFFYLYYAFSLPCSNILINRFLSKCKSAVNERSDSTAKFLEWSSIKILTLHYREAAGKGSYNIFTPAALSWQSAHLISVGLFMQINIHWFHVHLWIIYIHTYIQLL